jgi:hypothetical protein
MATQQAAAIIIEKRVTLRPLAIRNSIISVGKTGHCETFQRALRIVDLWSNLS